MEGSLYVKIKQKNKTSKILQENIGIVGFIHIWYLKCEVISSFATQSCYRINIVNFGCTVINGMMIKPAPDMNTSVLCFSSSATKSILSNPIDCGLLLLCPQGILLKVRRLEWVTMHPPPETFQPRNQNWASHCSQILTAEIYLSRKLHKYFYLTEMWKKKQ